MRFIFRLIPMLLLGSLASALEDVVQSFTLDGKLYSDVSAGTPLLGTGTLKIQIVDSLQTCVLYEEIQSFDTTASGGAFNIEVGEATTPVFKRSAGDSGHRLSDVFLNDGSLITGKLISNGNPCAGSASPGSSRYVRITVIPTSGSPRVLSPNLPLSSIPSALVAENAQTLSGKTASQFVNVNTNAPSALSQSNLENIFSTTNYPKLTDLLSGNSPSYVKAMTNNSIQIPSSGSTPSIPTAGQLWYESGTLKFWNGSSAQALGVSGSGITSLIVGSGLAPAGTISTGGQTIAVDVGTGDGQIVQVQAGGKLPVLDGSNLTNLKDTSISGDLSVTSIATSGSGTIGANLTVIGVATTGELWTNKLKVYDGSNSIELKAPTLAGSTAYDLPAAYPAVTGYVLSSSTSGVMSWVPQTNAGITSLGGQTGTTQIFVSGSAGTAPAINSSSNTHTLNVPLASGSGVTSGTISKAEYDAFNAKLGTSTTFAGDIAGPYNNVSVEKIKGKAVSGAPTTAGQILRYDGTNFAPAYLSMFDLRSTLTGASAFGGVGCLANQTLTWTAATDNLACSNITGVAAANITNTPSGNIAATTVQAAVNELDTEKIAKNGDTMTGTLNLPVNGLVVGGSQLVAVSGKIGIGTTSAGVSLDLKNNTDAIALPSGTTAQRPSSPVNGYTRYNTDMKGVETYVNGSWQSVASGITPTASEDGMSLRWNEAAKQFQWFTPGAAGAGIATLNGLSVSSQNFAIGTAGTAPLFNSATSTHTLNIPMANTASVTAGLISKTEYDAFNSKLGTTTSFGGDVSGTYNAISVDRIKGKAVTAAPSVSGQMLVYNGTALAPVAMSGDATMLASGSLTLKNTGSVGTYFKVTTDAQGRVVSGATGLGTTEIPDLPWSKITSGTPTTLAGYGITDGVRNIATGAGLTGGPITSTGTISLSAATVNGLWTGDGTNVWRASGKVGVGTNNPSVSLDLKSTVDALALPSGSTAQRPASPVNGYTRYNTDMKGVEAYINGGWQQIAAGASPTASEDGKTLRWNNTTKQFDWFTAGAAGAGIGTLNGLTASSQNFAIGTGGPNPHIDSVTSTHTLHIPMANTASATAGLISKTEYDNFNAKLGTATAHAGDVSGPYNNLSVDKIKGVAVSATAPTSSQILVYNGTTYAPATLSSDITIGTTGVATLKNTGTAGTYLKVTTDAQGRVSSGSTSLALSDLPSIANQTLLANTSGSAAAPSATTLTALIDSVTGSTAQGNLLYRNATGWVSLPAGTSGQFLKTNGAGANPAWAAAPAGTMTSVTAGTGLTGGSITTSGTIGLGTELTGVNTLSTTGVVKRTGAGAYTAAAVGLASADVTGTLPIANGGTNATTAAAALANLLPTQTGQNGKVLQTDGTTATWTTPSATGVTNVAAGAGLAGGPITSTGTISLATIASYNVLANTSGSAAVPVATTVPALLNTISATQGTILYRNASTWVALSPGTSGQFLKTNGASADPSWAAAPAGSVTSVAVAVPSFMSSSGGPITSSGTISLAYTSQTAGLVLAAPVGASGVPTFRSLNIEDINSSVSGDWFTASGACPSGQTLTYSAVSDNLSCQAYALTSSQVTTALGFTPANATSVAGTANYVPKFTSASAIGNSSIFDNGNVGIGTAAPNAKLTVQGGMTFSQLAADPAGTASYGSLYTKTDGKLYYRSGTGTITDLSAAGSGVNSLNGLSVSSQTFAVPGTSGTAPAWVSSGSTHTLNIPLASAASVTAGLLSKADYDAFAAKLGTATALAGDVSGAYNATSVDKIKGKAVTAAPSVSGQMLVYNGTALAPVAMSGDATMLSTGAVTLKNTGTAGTYYKVTTDAQGRVSSGVASLATSDLPSIASNTVLANTTAGTAAPTAVTVPALLNTVSSTQGSLLYRNASGWVALAPGSAGQVLQSGGASANPSWVTGPSGTITGSGTANALPKFTSATALGNSTIYETGTGVGIGTTSPGAKLHVNGPIRIAASTLPGSPATGDMAVDSGDGNKLKWYNGTGWQVAGSSGSIAGAANITGASYTITSAQSGYYFTYNGSAPGTINLPALSSLGDGFQVTIARQAAQSLTITPNGSDGFPSGLTTFEMRGQNIQALTLTKIGSKWNVTNKSDDCIAGQSCWGTNNIYVGVYKGHQYFTTPGGCTDSATPTCAGGADTVQKKWRSNTSVFVGADNFTDGQSQSAALASGYADADAAKFCEDMVYAGYSDWYLPSKLELEFLYRNSESLTGFTYSTMSYRSSTESATNTAWNFYFNNASPLDVGKSISANVRCVRRF